MRRWMFAITFLNFLWLGASARPVSQLEIARGFMDIGDPQVPGPVRAAARSVFEIRVPKYREHSYQVFDVSSDRYKNFKAKFAGLEAIRGVDRIFIQKQIEACDRERGHTQCPLFLESRAATAFLALGRLWTNAHVVNDYLVESRKATRESLEQLKEDRRAMPIYVFDGQGNMVFNPFTDNAVLASIPDHRTEDKIYVSQSDLVSFSLSRSLGPSLKIADLKVSEHFYILGFADCTACSDKILKTDAHDLEEQENPLDFADRNPFKNSDGRGLKITSGPEASLIAVADFLGLSAEKLSAMGAGNMLFISGDSRQGMSGGPILNSSGEVAGIFAGAKSQLRGGQHFRLSRGVRADQMK